MKDVTAAAKINGVKKILASLPIKRQNEYVPLTSALGRVLAKSLTAKISVPQFDKSAFDGYALKSEDIKNASKENPITLSVTETIAAGCTPTLPVGNGYAARIMTGAMTPKGADTVVKYEDTQFTNDTVTFFEPAKGASNIAHAGEDVLKGALLIDSGSLLCAAEIAVFAAQGHKNVEVYKKPVVTVISTGSELLAPDSPLEPGKIYNSNGSLIRGFLEVYGIEVRDGGVVSDDIEKLTTALIKAFENSDAVITTGGVSVGDFDYMERAAKEAGAEILFHTLPFKPGGAMLGAQREGKLLLGLSGNPSAAATGLLFIGLPYLKKLEGLNNTEFMVTEALLEKPFSKKTKNLRLLWGKKRIEGGKLIFCQPDSQKNGMVTSMLGCDLLGEIPSNSDALAKGTPIKAYIL